MKPRTASRLAWSLWAVAAMLAAGAIVFLMVGWSSPTPEGQFGFRGFGIIFAVTYGTVGALIASRHPGNPIGWIFCGGAIASGFQELANQYAIYALLAHEPALPLGAAAAWIPAWIWIPGTGLAMFVLLLFPDGHLPSPRWRWVAWIGVAGTLLGSVGLALRPGPLENFTSVDNPFAVGTRDVMGALGSIGQLVWGLATVGSAIALVQRFRRSRGDEREQLKWLALSGVFLSLSLFTSFILQIASGGAGAEVYLAVAIVVISGFTAVPIGTGIAILKYRLYDIDVVINETVVYGVLAAFITVVYVGIVVGVGTAIGSRGNVVLSAVAAALVAVAFQPVRRWAQRLANRLVYGERATPYAVLAGFSERVAEGYSIADVLPRMARILGEGIGAARVAVWLRVGRELRPAGAWPDATGLSPVQSLPELPHPAFEVRHQGETLGAITVTMPPAEPITPVQEKLIRDVSGQAGLVLRNVRLIEELRASRQRLVAAQDEERRRIERDIHDGAQQQLVALTVKARLAHQLVERDPAKTGEMLTAIEAETQSALADLRDLARGIYPPLLADGGLAAALEAQARKSPIPVSVEPDGIGRYPQEVESAVYFSCLEALQNVAKYAEASRATIALDQTDRTLSFSVADDGRGFDVSNVAHGSGLQGMVDRLDAIGGRLEVDSTPGSGTVVTGRIPTRVVAT